MFQTSKNQIGGGYGQHSSYVIPITNTSKRVAEYKTGIKRKLVTLTGEPSEKIVGGERKRPSLWNVTNVYIVQGLEPGKLRDT